MAKKAIETTPVEELELTAVPLEDIEVVETETASFTTTDLINLAILSAKNHPLETQIVSRLNEAKQFII
jgi:hypothetical protein